MLNKLVILIVTLVHMNGSMFLPQVVECDIYNSNGQQQDDFDTLIDYVVHIIDGTHSNTPVDEDNDQGQNFHLVKIVDYRYATEFHAVRHKTFIKASREKYHTLQEENTYLVTLEILAPPPKA